MPVETLNTSIETAEVLPEFAVPVQKFVATLAGTPEEIWSRLIVVGHRRESHTMREWREILTKAKGS